MTWWQILIFPIAVIYDSLTRFRNHLYNIGYTRSFRFDVKTLAVGNLSVGGSGKSPMVEYLLRYLLSKGWRPATLSRGYGRKSRGFRIATDNDNAHTLGDEPANFYENYGDRVVVAVGEERVLAIPSMLLEHPDIQVIVLDDAFQHRKVDAHLNLMLTTYERPFYADFVLPSGRLREAREGARRADAVIVTKCPDNVDRSSMTTMTKQIETYAPGKPVFFTKVTYCDHVSFGKKVGAAPKKFVLVAGIAENQHFLKAMDSLEVRKTFQFPDHHNYNSKEIVEIIENLNDETALCTTEKDFIKLKAFQELLEFPCYYVPIRVEFLSNEEGFQQIIDRTLQ